MRSTPRYSRRWFMGLGLGCVLFLSAWAGSDLQNAFSVLTNSTSAGLYTSQVRGFMTAGSFSVGFPQRSVNFIDITPPSINAGCDGISVFWGGISYISGEQFVAMLKGIAADSLGEAFSIALRTLCPVCSTVLADLQKAAQAASQLAMNQCAAAMSLLDTGIHSIPGLRKFIKARASLGSSQSGHGDDFLGAFSDFTNAFSQAIAKRVKDLKQMMDPGERQAAVNASLVGNRTWKYLAGLTRQQKVFLMSLLGTVIVRPTPSIDNATNLKKVLVSSTLTPKDLASIFIFGADAKRNANLVVLQCKATAPQPGQAVGKGDATSSTLYPCAKLQTVPLKNSYWYSTNTQDNTKDSTFNITQIGFYGLSYALMFQALDNILQNKPLSTPQTITLPSALYGDNYSVKVAFTQEEIEGFLSLAPVPLYRAINIAAFDGRIATQLINSVSEMIATHYAVAYIDRYILNLKQTDGQAKNVSHQGLSQKRLHKLQAAIHAMRTYVRTDLVLLLQHWQMNAAWIDQVNQVENTIYQQILRNGLANHYAYGLGLTGN